MKEEKLKIKTCSFTVDIDSDLDHFFFGFQCALKDSKYCYSTDNEEEKKVTYVFPKKYCEKLCSLIGSF